MLAVFDKSVAKSPEALQSPQSGSVSTLKDGFLANHFGSLHPGSVTVNLASSGLIAYSLQNKNPLLPRYSTIPFLLRTKKLKIWCIHLVFFLGFMVFGLIWSWWFLGLFGFWQEIVGKTRKVGVFIIGSWIFCWVCFTLFDLSLKNAVIVCRYKMAITFFDWCLVIFRLLFF